MLLSSSFHFKEMYQIFGVLVTEATAKWWVMNSEAVRTCCSRCSGLYFDEWVCNHLYWFSSCRGLECFSYFSISSPESPFMFFNSDMLARIFDLFIYLRGESVFHLWNVQSVINSSMSLQFSSGLTIYFIFNSPNSTMNPLLFDCSFGN